MKRRIVPISLITLVLGLIMVLPVAAHQPFFEEEDIVFNDPWAIADPSVSTVVYATLESTADVDYFVFQAQAGETIQLGITIPQIEGQDDFAPTMALLGPGLPVAELPARVERVDGGAVVFPPDPGPASTFFEPFSRTSYWDRQEARIRVVEGGRYMAAVWHSEGQTGRYAFVVGYKEQLGGDLLGMRTKLGSYWTPFIPAQTTDDNAARSSGQAAQSHEHAKKQGCQSWLRMGTE